ncbi:MAG: valine--tRNA ligase [Barrevirus sp.]|uniref:valine--tRNA ligase n=1 Tax=Barrevirus sp. TaxID=2487763 RepID=A0A3G4ZQD7_9VIRU|nr:MAG: valine--tRNA ligase [Barrevirus sp.]
MSNIPVNYDPKEIEDKWYKFWLDNELFTSTIDSKKTAYTILLPPPNVSGSLHLGHAINNTFIDILIRFKKLQGFNTLLIPGLDHGGLGTEQMVSKSLMAEKGLTKEELGLNNFLTLVWQWKEEKSKIINSQIKKLGLSCDWSKEQFTLSPKLSKIVNTVFKELYDKDMIYRGKYIINYCVKCGTALANDEVEHIDNHSKLYYIKYIIEGSTDHILVSTTRPETLLGDVAIAFNPEDSKYKSLLGKNVIVPFVGRIIPIIEDSFVKIDFGTGLVKITSAHDKDDYEVAKRHKLSCIDIIDKKGKICGTGTMFDNLPIMEARKKIIEELTLVNLFEVAIGYQNKIGSCYRCKEPIETLLSDQYFVKTEKLRHDALTLINDGSIKFVPEEHREHICRWLSNDVDWCISRSISWGHQIPIWYCSNCPYLNCSITEMKICQQCNSENLVKETDVLDTWFSSALWAFSVFDTKEDYDYYFPSDTLVTGSDILFFWVGRMIMMTSEIHKVRPFKEVFLHGLVRDSDGVKMSKTLGNGINPIDIIDQFSADILRFSLMYSTNLGHDTNVGKESFEIGKTFCAKLWNSFRYIMGNIDNEVRFDKEINKDTTSLIDNFILNKLNVMIKLVETSLQNYDFGNTIRKLYSFIWDDFCNCYLECAKATIDSMITKKVLINVFDTIILLLHPFIPFLTEEIFQNYKGFFSDLKDINSIMLRSWPSPFITLDEPVDDADKLFSIHREITKIIRQVKGNYEIAKTEKIHVILITDNEKIKNYIQNTDIYIKRLCWLSEITYELYKDKQKYIIEENKKDDYTLYFPIDERYKVDAQVKSLEDRIKIGGLKIEKLEETIGQLKSKKKVLKFEHNIKEVREEINELEKKIEYLKSSVI